jgi:hypothetical protein
MFYIYREDDRAVMTREVREHGECAACSPDYEEAIFLLEWALGITPTLDDAGIPIQYDGYEDEDWWHGGY